MEIIWSPLLDLWSEFINSYNAHVYQMHVTDTLHF